MSKSINKSIGIKDPKLTSPRTEQLTPDQLRAITRINMSDEKADEIIQSIRLFCKVLYQYSVSVKSGYILSLVDPSNAENITKEAA